MPAGANPSILGSSWGKLVRGEELRECEVLGQVRRLGGALLLLGAGGGMSRRVGAVAGRVAAVLWSSRGTCCVLLFVLASRCLFLTFSSDVRLVVVVAPPQAGIIIGELEVHVVLLAPDFEVSDWVATGCAQPLERRF